MSVSGLATDSPCGVWAVDEPLAFSVVVQFRVYVFKRQLVCKFEIVEKNFPLMFSFYYCLYTLPK